MIGFVSKANAFTTSLVKSGLKILIATKIKGQTTANIKTIKAQYRFDNNVNLTENARKMDIVPESGWFKSDLMYKDNKILFTFTTYI